MVSGPVMNALPGPVLFTLRRTAYFEARYIGFASSSPLAPEMLTFGSAAALCAAVAAASAAMIAAPTSRSTDAPHASSAVWMRAWSGLTMAGSAATCAPGGDGSASGGSAPSGRVTSELDASRVAQSSSSVGSRGSGGRSASDVATPTWYGSRDAQETEEDDWSLQPTA